jgi:hypothetical protein
MYTLVFIYLAVSMGQDPTSYNIENVAYAVFDSEQSCIIARPSLHMEFKHKLLTEFQAVPLFTSMCASASVEETFLTFNEGQHRVTINKRISDHDLER